MRGLPTLIHKSMGLVGGIMLILGLSLASTTYMIDAGVPQQLLAVIDQYVTGQTLFLLLLLGFLLVLGAQSDFVIFAKLLGEVKLQLETVLIVLLIITVGRTGITHSELIIKGQLILTRY